MDNAFLAQAQRYAGGSGLIIRHGAAVASWGDTHRWYDIQSVSKSIGVTALGIALSDGVLRLEDRAHRWHPSLGLPPEENRATGWLEEITVRHLATMTAGFDKEGGYTRMLFAPGTRWGYSDGGANWLAECLTRVYKRDLADLLWERVFAPLGLSCDQMFWRDNIFRPAHIGGIPNREIGAGIFCSVDAMARIGYLYLRDGEWEGRPLIPREFVRQAQSPCLAAGLPVVNDPQERFSGASAHYGLLWWNNVDQALPNVPRDAYWAYGLGDSLIVVMPSLDIVVARSGGAWPGSRKPSYYRLLEPFLDSVVAALHS
jgi:CubicO group peptidase (beta-lactamase class C family)